MLSYDESFRKVDVLIYKADHSLKIAYLHRRLISSHKSFAVIPLKKRINFENELKKKLSRSNERDQNTI